MRALVTGPDGVLGSELVRLLLDRGVQVRVLLQPGSEAPTLAGLEVERHVGDLGRDDPSLAERMSGCDVVYHLAAVTNPWAPAELHWEVNDRGTRRVLDAARDAGVERVVGTGSAACYQPGTLQAGGTEDSPFPEAYRDQVYALAKRAGIERLQRARASHGLHAVVVSPTFMLGRHVHRRSSAELVLHAVRTHPRFAPPGGKNLVHARDVAHILVAASEQAEPGSSWLAAGTNLTYLDLFTRIARLDDHPAPLGVLPRRLVRAAGVAGSAWRKLTGMDVRFDRKFSRWSVVGAWYDGSKARKAFDVPITPVDDGIYDVLYGLRAYGHVDTPLP